MKNFIDQHPVTVIARIIPEKLRSLEDLLSKIHCDIEGNEILPFKGFDGVHFCRFLILEPSGTIKDHQLVYSSNFDESEAAHLTSIRNNPLVLSGFDRIFSHCADYNKRSDPASDAVAEFILSKKKEVHTFYRGHRGLSLKQIKAEQMAYENIQGFLDNTNVKTLAEDKIAGSIKQHMRLAMPDLKVPEIRLTHLGIPAVITIYVILPLLIVFVAAAFLGIFWYTFIPIAVAIALIILILRRLENRATEMALGNNIKESQQKAEELKKFEDFQVQNQLSHLVELRPGIFRRSLQKFALAALNKLAVLTYNQGRLGDIATIHFARWSLIDNGRRLLFFSNFDGSWENYLGDFVDRAAPGLTLAWSNTDEFPKTRFLALDGATNEELFKAWTRKNQIVTNVWYTAYKDITVKNILRNHRIALGLQKDLTGNELKEWLKLL